MIYKHLDGRVIEADTDPFTTIHIDDQIVVPEPEHADDPEPRVDSDDPLADARAAMQPTPVGGSVTPGWADRWRKPLRSSKDTAQAPTVTGGTAATTLPPLARDLPMAEKWRGDLTSSKSRLPATPPTNYARRMQGR